MDARIVLSFLGILLALCQAQPLNHNKLELSYRNPNFAYGPRQEVQTVYYDQPSYIADDYVKNKVVSSYPQSSYKPEQEVKPAPAYKAPKYVTEEPQYSPPAYKKPEIPERMPYAVPSYKRDEDSRPHVSGSSYVIYHGNDDVYDQESPSYVRGNFAYQDSGYKPRPYTPYTDEDYDPKYVNFDGRRRFNRYGSYNRPYGHDGKETKKFVHQGAIMKDQEYKEGDNKNKEYETSETYEMEYKKQRPVGQNGYADEVATHTMKKTIYSYDSSNDAKRDAYPRDGYLGNQKYFKY